MSVDEQLSSVTQVFISSSTRELAQYRDSAIRSVRGLGMHQTNYNDPAGVGISHRNQTIFEMNRETIHQADVFVGLYGFGGVWRPASHPGLTEAHPELLTDPDKLIMEYEYEWAREADLSMFPFVCTDRTTGIPPVDVDDRMYRFRLKVMARNVGWLTTPEAFADELSAKLRSIEPKVFLSYSRQNEQVAKELQRRLRDEDVFVWRDKTNIGGSVEWAKALESALARLEALVVVVTAESAKSEWVERECRDFAGMGKRIFPYIADPRSRADLPGHLKALQYIDGTQDDGFRQLAKTLRGALHR
jgi:hypothetical protein